jgi:hypothetical protein
MKVQFGRLSRLSYGVMAVAILGVTLVPALSGRAYALFGQVNSRYIKMSSSANGATGTSYEIGFQVATAGAVQGVGVDFCSNSPIIGDTCTAPTGFTVGAATTTGSVAGMTGTWSGASGQSGRTLLLTLATPSGSASAAAQGTFTLTTATNPTNTNTTFYARIYTFATAAAVGTWNTANTTGNSTTGVVDAGGVAMSTDNQVLVTAKVQEQLTFCVYTGANCGAGGGAVNLGDSNGVLSSGTSYVDKNTKYDVSTNAASGATIRLKIPTTLTSGSNTIAAIGATATASAAGTAQFGLCTYQSTGANLTPVAPYATLCSTTSQGAAGQGTANFALDMATTCGTANDGNTTCTYGDQLATVTAGASSTGVVAYIANIPVTQAAGVYTSTSTYVATGTY